MYLDIIKSYWKEAIAYKAEYYISVLINPVRFALLLLIWSAVYSNTESGVVGDYTLPNLITYFLITSLIYTFIYDTISNDLEETIKKGDFLIYMLKPISYMKLQFVKKIGARIFAFLIEIIPTLVIFLLFFKKYFVPGNIVYFSISLLIAFILSYLIYLSIGMIAFWLINIRTLAWMVTFGIQITSGLFVPISFFPKTLQEIMSVLPFQNILYVPANIYLNKYSYDLSLGFVNTIYFHLVIQVIWCIVLFIFVNIIWKKAIKRFSGVGS